MSTTTLTFQGRLPGVECTPGLPPADQPLRLDVAAFVGFAQSGPLDVPVPVEDINQFTAVFGGELVVAANAGLPVYAQLPGAVRAFFDNGGRRCHVVRVAGPDARAARWAVPGLQVWQPDGTVADATVEAAWPGAWSAGTQLETRLLVRPLATAGPYSRAGDAAAGQLPLAVGTGVAIQPGDLIRLEFAAPLPLLYGRVLALAAGTSTLLLDVELPYQSGDTDRPAPGALDGLPEQLPVVSAALLRMDLVARQHLSGGSRLLERQTDLAFNSPASAAAPTAASRPVWTDVLQPAGDPTPDGSRSTVLRADPASVSAASTGLVVPVGMQPADSAADVAGPSTAAIVDGFDDLDTFAVAPFVDPRLAQATIYSLVEDAAQLTVLAPHPSRLTGVHALLDVDEVALVSMPDATQVGWTAPATATEPPVGDDPAGYDESGLIGVQAALVTMCAARGDLVALLSVPAHYDPVRVLAWRDRLTSTGALSDGASSGTSPLSYAGYWYPWLRVPEATTPGLAPLRAIPPDGPVAGTIAARELARGAWIAPANIPLRGPVQLMPALRDTETARLFDAHANLLRQLPGTITALSAHTLSTEPTLLQLSVRRLLILIRKIALAQGHQYVFQTDNEQFRQLVRMRFERVLATMAAAGAFTAYQVVTAGGDDGSVVVYLQIAPSDPIEFITISLVRSGEGLLDVLES